MLTVAAREGEWRENKAHGRGTYIESNGRRLHGQWRKGCLDNSARSLGNFFASLGERAAALSNSS